MASKPAYVIPVDTLRLRFRVGSMFVCRGYTTPPDEVGEHVITYTPGEEFDVVTIMDAGHFILGKTDIGAWVTLWSLSGRLASRVGHSRPGHHYAEPVREPRRRSVTSDTHHARVDPYL